jgi:hypothetical protein
MSEIKNVSLGETNPWEIIDYSLFRKFGTLVSKNYTTGLFFKMLYLIQWQVNIIPLLQTTQGRLSMFFCFKNWGQGRTKSYTTTRNRKLVNRKRCSCWKDTGKIADFFKFRKLGSGVSKINSGVSSKELKTQNMFPFEEKTGGRCRFFYSVSCKQ